MHYHLQSFNKIENAVPLPKVLLDLICVFTYNISSFEELECRMVAFFNIARVLPVPRKWKALVRYRVVHGRLHATINYNNFYKHVHSCPFSAVTQISLKGVRKTINLLNWTVLKGSDQGTFEFMKSRTKREIIIEHSFWSYASVVGIFFLQRLLVSVRRQHIRRVSFKQKFDYIFLRESSPLGMYLKAPFTYGLSGDT
jgi:hypothetical protein